MCNQAVEIHDVFEQVDFRPENLGIHAVSDVRSQFPSQLLDVLVLSEGTHQLHPTPAQSVPSQSIPHPIPVHTETTVVPAPRAARKGSHRAPPKS